MKNKKILEEEKFIEMDDRTLLYHLYFSLSEILRFYCQVTLLEKEINPNNPSENFKEEIDEALVELRNTVIADIDSLLEEYKDRYYSIDDFVKSH